MTTQNLNNKYINAPPIYLGICHLIKRTIYNNYMFYVYCTALVSVSFRSTKSLISKGCRTIRLYLQFKFIDA